MNCYRPASTNEGTQSILFDTIYNNIVKREPGMTEEEVEERAEEMYSYFLTSDFSEKFGDFVGNYKNRLSKGLPSQIATSRLDDNGEPKLMKDENKNQYFYRDRFGLKRAFPVHQGGLIETFSPTEIIEISSILALDYASKHLNLNYQDVEIDKDKKIQESLLESIRTKLSEKTEEFRSYDDEIMDSEADRLQDSFLNLDEWQENAEAYFKQLKLKYSEEDVELDELATSERGSVKRQASFEKSTRDNISANVKLRLSLLTSPEHVDSFFGDPKLLPLDEVLSTLMTALSDRVNEIDETGTSQDLFPTYLRIIRELSESKPYLKDLIKEDGGLGDPDLDENIKYEFVQAFNLHKNNFIVTTFRSYDKNSQTFDFMDVTESGSLNKIIEENWKANFIGSFVHRGALSKRGRQKFDKHRLRFEDNLEAYMTYLDKNELSEDEINKHADNLIKRLHKFGVTISLDEEGDAPGFNYFLDGLSTTTGDLYVVQEQLRDLYNATKKVLDKVDKGEADLTKSPFADQSEFSDLAKAEAFFSNDKTEATIFAGGKTQWVYSYPSYMSTKIKEFKQDPSLLRDILENDVQGESSQWIKYLLAEDQPSTVSKEFKEAKSKERLEKFKLGVFNTFQEYQKGKESVGYSDISKNDFYADTFNKIIGGPNHIYSTPVPADKSNLLQLSIGYMKDVGARLTKDGAFTMNDHAKEALLDYFVSDYKRIGKVHQEIKDNIDKDGNPIDKSLFRVHYHVKQNKKGEWTSEDANGLKSQLFPSLSPKNFDSEEAGFELYDADGKPIADLNKIEGGENALREAIKEYMMPIIQTEVMNIEELMYEKNILTKDYKGDTVNKGLDSRKWNEYEGDTLRIAGDVLVNGIISQIEFSKLFSGDVAYYKDPVDYKKRIPANYIDGLTLRMTEEDSENFNTAIVESIYLGSPFINELNEMLEPEIAKYYASGINAADAQAWITPQRWKWLITKMGKWTEGEDSYQSIYDKMMNEDGSETLTAAELKKAAQPLKGVYFERNGGVPTYLKYSQAVLVPRLIKGTSLEKMYDKMTKDEKGNEKAYNDQIHEVVTLDGMKVGSIVPDKIHDGNNIMEDFTLTPLQLKNSGYRLQQDLPTKTYKSTDLGSQLEKNIYGGLAFNRDVIFEIDGKELTGQEVIELLHRVSNAIRDKNKGSLMAEFQIDNEGNIGNYERLYEALKEDLAARGGNPNVMQALEAETSPYGIPQAKKTLMQIFSSMFTKKLVKMKTNGGSFVQLSNFGISKPDNINENEPTDGIIWSPAIAANETLSEPKFLKDEDGNHILNESGKKIVQPGGVLVSGAFIAKHIPDYKKFSPLQLFGKYNKKTGEYEGGMIDSKILKGLIGYRIPNQALASNDGLQIVGILPESEGDTIVAYTGITTKTGSDFDIDKMYIMMPEMKPKRFEYNKLRKYALSQLRGKTLRETNANIAEIIDQLDEDSLSILRERGRNSEKLARLLDSKTKEHEVRDLEIDMLVELVTNNKKTSNSILLDNIKEEVDLHRVEKLEYVELAKKRRKHTPEELDTIKAENDGELPKGFRDTTYDEIAIEDQSKDALNNLMMNIYSSVLLNEANINEVMTPIDFPYMKDDINNLYPKDEAGDLTSYNVAADIETKYEFIAGKAGVGMEANAFVDHMRGSMANLVLHDYSIGWGNKNDKDETAFDKEMSEALSDEDIKYYLEVINEGLSEEDKYTEEYIRSIKISNSLSAILNAFVDIAKDPYITRGNWTTQTTNVGNLLIRAGVHPFYVNAFLGQPIIKEYVEFTTNKESKIVKDSGNLQNKFKIEQVKKSLQGSLTLGKITIDNADIYTTIAGQGPNDFELQEHGIDTVLEDLNIDEIATLFKIDNVARVQGEALDVVNRVLDKIKGAHSTVFSNEDVDVTELSLSKIRKQITEEADGPIQQGMLNKFFELLELSKGLRDNMRGSRQDTHGYGKNIPALMSAANNINKMLAEDLEPGQLAGFREKLIINGQKTYLGGVTENVIFWVKDLMEKNPFFFLTANPVVANTFNEISKDLRDDVLTDEELGETLEDYYYTYIMSSFEPLNVPADERAKFVQEFPDKFDKFKNQVDEDGDRAIEKGEYAILEELRPMVTADEDVYLGMSGRKRSPFEQLNIIASWQTLLEEYPEMGENLIKYAFLTSGFSMNLNQFFTYIPTQWLIENDINYHIMQTAEKLNNMLADGKEVDEAFIEQVYRNNYDNNTLAPLVFGSSMDYISDEGFILNKKGKARKYVKRQGTEEFQGREEQWTDLYKLRGYTEDNRAVYLKANKLGLDYNLKNKISEYSFGEPTKTVFRRNRAVFNKVKKASLLNAIGKGPEAFNIEVKMGEINFKEEVKDEINCKFK